MNDDELWAAIDAQRLRTADLLATLAPADWSHRSLCDGWTVRDVAGHLTLQQMTLGDGLRLALKHPGLHSLNWMIQTSARDQAALPTEQIIGAIRGMVGSRRHNLGVTPRETLIDIVVHGQDIAIPIGRTLPVPAEVAATAAERVWECRGTRLSKVFKPVPYDGLKLVADDVDWSVGDGPELRGPVLSLLLLLTGRRVVLPQLDGPGAAALQRV
ncbi:maleylpyruvate isomerase family mycothiol-dependent enzyme [Kribbella sindirgiensis]|uniref:Maleylpyruvate isomerase family mycothiol-dependent enzyme n=1 Tax=Kribbella sindirgiensis TaxID=1124744 RepID=A0A4R0I8D2_9ACTN|nr:maleylpyruvate isomerase family mycothiol-dependent enzyme [Kribbella sindirgiensis]TCC29181.1 maleylpyruvate isomerase family mycothiol-dependent enzyme [Kribbella sindirgiensis]